MAAAGGADVLARDLHPLVLGRRRQHPLEQRPVAGLQLGSLAQLALGRADSLGERVAQRLQLPEPQGPRLPGDRRHGDVDRRAREALGNQLAELPLEAADLASQLCPREALVSGQAERQCGVSLHQSHAQSLTPRMRQPPAFSLYFRENA